MDMRLAVLWVLGLVQLCGSQSSSSMEDRGFIKRRKHMQQFMQSFPCYSRDYTYDPVNEDVQGRKLLLAAGAAVGGAALGYHLGMKHQNQPIINNNIYNEYPPPCVVVQSGSSGGIIGGGGLLGHHPILSNIIHGGLLGGGGGGLLGNGGLLGGGGNNGGTISRQGEVNWNRAIRQFNRLVRPITRGFK